MKLGELTVHFLNTIAYPEYFVNNTGLNEKYKKLDIDQVHFFNMIVLTRVHYRWPIPKTKSNYSFDEFIEALTINAGSDSSAQALW